MERFKKCSFPDQLGYLSQSTRLDQEVQISQTSKIHLNSPGARSVTRGKVHTGSPQILGADGK